MLKAALVANPQGDSDFYLLWCEGVLFSFVDHVHDHPHFYAALVSADGVGEGGDGGFGQGGELAVGHRHDLVAPAVVDGAEILVLFQPSADRLAGNAGEMGAFGDRPAVGQPFRRIV